MDGLTYPEIGATRTGDLPAGYDHLRYRVRLPGGFAAAGEAVLTWRLHRAAGVAVRASAPRAEPGATVHIGLGAGPVRLWAPCAVVWTVQDGYRAGFGYGTLAGHPERGEEAFLVSRGPNGTVWFEVTAFSRPARWFTMAAGPLTRGFQRAYARRLGRVLARLCRDSPG